MFWIFQPIKLAENHLAIIDQSQSSRVKFAANKIYREAGLLNAQKRVNGSLLVVFPWLPSLDDLFSARIRILRHCPKALRGKFKNLLRQVYGDVVQCS